MHILTWKCASRHNGVQFFISHLASWLRTRRFSEPTFRPSGATNHWKNTVFRDFPTFSRICIFFLLTLLSSNLSLLSASSLLCFSSVHIVGSLTSKLPSISSTRSIGSTSSTRSGCWCRSIGHRGHVPKAQRWQVSHGKVDKGFGNPCPGARLDLAPAARWLVWRAHWL